MKFKKLGFNASLIASDIPTLNCQFFNQIYWLLKYYDANIGLAYRIFNFKYPLLLIIIA